MQNLNKNGSYVERRKMYIEYRKNVIKALHNMKSKIPIEWTEQDRLNYQQNRILTKQRMEKEYIKNVYNQKMERIIKERYNPNYDAYNPMYNDSRIRPQEDVLSKEVQQFNTSKIMSSSFIRNNPENAQRLPHEAYSRNIQGEQNQSQSKFKQNRQPNPNGQRKERVYNDRKEKYESQNSERGYSNGESNHVQRNYNDRERMPEQPRYQNQKYHSNERPYNLYRDGSYQRSQGELSRQSRNNRPDLSPKPYYGMPQQNSYNARLRQYRRSVEFPYQQKPQHPYHPFRNNLPDRLQSFLRQKSKADRKSVISVDLVSRQKSF